MTYKLKDHVTGEMLKSAGFKPKYYSRENYYKRDCLFYMKSVPEIPNEIIIGWTTKGIVLNGYGCRDVKPYIQDLIAKGWVGEG